MRWIMVSPEMAILRIFRTGEHRKHHREEQKTLLTREGLKKETRNAKSDTGKLRRLPL